MCGEYLKCLDRLQEWVPHTNTRKKRSYQYTCVYKYFVLDVQPPRPPDLNYLVFLSVGHVKIPVFFFQLQLNVKKHFTIALFMLVRSFTTLPGSSKGCDTLGICCELWLDKQKELEGYEIANVHTKCILSAVSKILHIEGIYSRYSMKPPPPKKKTTYFRTSLHGLLSLFLCEGLTTEVCPSFVGTPCT